MGLYRLKNGSYGRREDDGRMAVYLAGKAGRDVLELNDEDAAAMAARIEPVRPDGAPVEPSEAERDAEVHGTSIADALTLIATVDDVEHLRAIAAREARNTKPKRGRKPVLKAVAERIAAMTQPSE